MNDAEGYKNIAAGYQDTDVQALAYTRSDTAYLAAKTAHASASAIETSCATALSTSTGLVSQASSSKISAQGNKAVVDSAVNQI